MLVALVLFTALVALAALAAKQRGAGTVELPYHVAKTLFSPAERSFLGVLDQAVGPEHTDAAGDG